MFADFCDAIAPTVMISKYQYDRTKLRDGKRCTELTVGIRQTTSEEFKKAFSSSVSRGFHERGEV